MLTRHLTMCKGTVNVLDLPLLGSKGTHGTQDHNISGLKNLSKNFILHSDSTPHPTPPRTEAPGPNAEWSEIEDDLEIENDYELLVDFEMVSKHLLNLTNFSDQFIPSMM